MAENFDLIFGSSASQSYSWNDSDYQNGWQTVGDTPPTREQFDALQRRADLKAQELNNRLAPIEENDTHDYRQPSTAYTAGQIKYHPSLPTGWYLECTTDGTTDAGALVITSPSVGGTVTDGTVVWTVQNVYTLYGGVINGRRHIINAVDDSQIVLAGGSTTLSDGRCGAKINLFGEDHAQKPGFFEVLVKKSTTGKWLVAKPDGNLTWANNDLAGSAIVAKSLGTNGYVKYASGLIVQWGEINIPVSEFSYSSTYDAIVNNMSTTAATITYPIAFTTRVCPALNIRGVPSNNKWLGYAQGMSVTTTKCYASVALNKGTTLKSTGSVIISWSAIGY